MNSNHGQASRKRMIKTHVKILHSYRELQLKNQNYNTDWKIDFKQRNYFCPIMNAFPFCGLLFYGLINHSGQGWAQRNPERDLVGTPIAGRKVSATIQNEKDDSKMDAF